MKIPQLSDLKEIDNDLVRLTALQIKKDFEMYGLEINLEDSVNNYQTLFSQIKPHIKYLSDFKFPKLLEVLYRIDLEEKTIFQFAENHPDFTIDEAISHLIIEREFKKVWIRKNYSS